MMTIVSEQQVVVSDIVQQLKEGTVIVYPPETSYGLGCDATNQDAVDNIFQIKKRQREKTLLVVFPNIDMIKIYVSWTPTLQKLADLYWPGPLTIVAPLYHRGSLADGVVADDNTIAFRVSSYPLVFSISDTLGLPLISTSANISAEESSYDVKNIINTFADQEYQPELLIDAGSLPHHSPSTIVRVEGTAVSVIRQGELVVM